MMARTRGLLALLLAVALMPACNGATASSSAASCKPSDIPAHDAKTVIVEGDPWSGYAPFRNNHLLDGTDYTSHYVEQICQDVRAGDVTAGRAGIEVTTLDQYLLNHPAGTVVGVIDQSEGADALALNTVDVPYLKNIDNLTQLVKQYKRDGKKPVLAYTGNSPSEMLLNELANTFEELNLADFRLVSVDQSASAFKMLKAHQAQLGVIWEPDTSAARAAGFSIAMSSKDVPDSIVDVIIASNKLIKDDPAAVSAVVRSFYNTMDGYLAQPTALTQFIAKDGNLDLTDAKSVLAGIKLYGTAEADVFMNNKVFPLDQPQAEQSVKAIRSVLALGHPGLQLSGAVVDGSYVHQLTR
jgi:ABC-type nitrate/sulfonate/bicarbonate transport system substrate-binding protein